MTINRIITYLFVVLLLTLICICIEVNGQEDFGITIKDISDSNFDNSDNMYIKYPDSSSNTICNYRFKLLVSTSLPQLTSLSLSLSPPVQLSMSTYTRLINATSTVFQLNILNVQYGIYQIDIMASVNTNPLINQSITINIDCQKVITEDLEYEIIGVAAKSNLAQVYNFGYLKLNGLRNSLVLDIVQFPSKYYSVSPNRLFQNYYMAHLRPEWILNSLTVGWVIQIQFPGGVLFDITFPSCYKSYLNIPYDFKLYPSVDSVTPFTPKCETGCNPLYTFNINASNDYYEPFILAIPPGNDNPESPKLIQSINGVNTYLGVLPFSNQTVPIYSQNGIQTISFEQAVTFVGQKLVAFDSFINSGFNTIYEQSSDFKGFLTIMMKDSFKYSYSEISVSLDDLDYPHRFPFGFVSGNNTVFKTDITILSNFNSFKPKFKFEISLYGTLGYTVQLPVFNHIQDNSFTTISSYKAEIMDDINKIMVTIEFTDAHGISFATLCSIYGDRYRADSLVSGTLKDGVFEMILDLNDKVSKYYPIVSFTNIIGIKQGHIFEESVSIQDPSSVYTIPYYFEPVPFNGTIGNTITFNITNIDDVHRPIAFKITDSSIIYTNDNDRKIPIKWNEAIKLFQVDFFILANSPIGVVPYLIQYSETCVFESSSLPSSHQLVIIKSDNVDMRGPIFSNIQKNSNIPSWIVTIEDTVNGFDHGYILVVGSLDNSLYNFSLSPNDTSLKSGDKYSGNYELLINPDNLEYNCIDQTYTIEQVHLVDKYGRISHYSKHVNAKDLNNGYISSPQLNPFIKYLNDPTVTFIEYICQGLQRDPFELGGTTLVYFTASKLNMDLGLLDRMISFEFQVQDLKVGLKSNQRPIVYLTTTYFEKTVECISSLLEINSTHAKYSCSVQVPIAFGYSNGGFILSVYGFINKASQYTGFSTQDLKGLGQSYYVDSSELSFNQSIITGASEISTRGGSIWVFGRSLKDQTFTIIYLDGIRSITTTTKRKSYNTAVLLTGIRSTLSPFVIITNGTPKSSQYIVAPINYVDSTPIIPSPASTSTIKPTNAPQTCIGIPKCGGPDRGICKESGCVCISPWIGNDCLSKVIIVPPPKINTTDPTVIIPTIPITPGGTSTSTSSSSSEVEESEIVFYKSLISLVAFRELDFNNQPKKTHIFKQWIFTAVNESTSSYFTNITNTNELGAEVVTNITTTLQWFTEITNITFAGTSLVMNPSTIKFTIEISSYSFSNNLNRLQLLMSASFESSEVDACSQSQFGDTSSGDNSNFIKLNIDDHSLYGRFIKRAVVDKIPKTIDNILLDSSLNPIDSSNIQIKSSIQSFIGINIPNFDSSVVVDPDFSVLISVDDNSNLNSQCNSNYNSGLSASKIAGIVVGSFAFVAIVVTSIFYSIYKKKKDLKIIKNINQKMQKIN